MEIWKKRLFLVLPPVKTVLNGTSFFITVPYCNYPSSLHIGIISHGVLSRAKRSDLEDWQQHLFDNCSSAPGVSGAFQVIYYTIEKMQNGYEKLSRFFSPFFSRTLESRFRIPDAEWRIFIFWNGQIPHLPDTAIRTFWVQMSVSGSWKSDSISPRSDEYSFPCWWWGLSMVKNTKPTPMQSLQKIEETDYRQFTEARQSFPASAVLANDPIRVKQRKERFTGFLDWWDIRLRYTNFSQQTFSRRFSFFCLLIC